MAPYHSRFNEGCDKYKQCCGCPLLPWNAAPNDPAGPDILDESIELYRPNSLFRSFEPKGAADKLLIYLILYITSCLRRLVDTKAAIKEQAHALLRGLACESFALPGQEGFALGKMMAPPASREEEDTIRLYLRQCREEVGRRLVERLFDTPDGQPNRLWLGFAHRRFMDRAGV